MNKILKSIICVIGIILLTIVLLLNLIFNTTISVTEVCTISVNKILPFIELLLLVFIIYFSSINIKYDSKRIKKKYLVFGIIIFIYVIAQVIWINIRNANPEADQKSVYELAVAIKENRVEDLLENGTTYGAAVNDRVYFERYSQQFSTAFIWSLIFRFFNSTNYVLLEYFNVLCNAILAVTIFLICRELSIKYKVNKYLSMILYLTFLTVPLLSTFIYGDLTGICFGMLGVYFIMKYTRTKDIKYALYSALSIALAYMLRMNILIFVIAMVLYLLLDLISKKESIKYIFIKIAVIIGFTIITILPATITKNYFCNKYNLNKNNNFPKTGYLLMGMRETYSAQGWYNFDLANIAYNDVEKAKVTYKDELKDRVKYLVDNPKYTIDFYIKKTSSMWTETTFASVRYNISDTFGYGKIENSIIDDILYNINQYISLYQKALVVIIFMSTIIIIIQKRKNISNEIILLLTIFIGGFLFHTIWEAKSRYVIPYIIALIPIASIELEKIKLNIKLFRKRKEKSK